MGKVARAPALIAEGDMPTPAELREGSQFYREAGRKETDPHLRHRLARHALALAQLAEKIESQEKMVKRDGAAA